MSEISEFIKGSWLFPIIQTIHIIGLILLVGTVSLVDFRLLGMGMRHRSVRELASRLAPWTSAGLFTVLVTGPLLFWSNSARYLNNPAFVFKMGLLSLALAGHFTIHRNAVRTDEVRMPVASTGQKVAAALSLLLWSGVVLAGRAIADFDIRPL